MLPDAEASSRDKRTIKNLKKQSRKLKKTVNSYRRQLISTRAQLPKPSIIEMVKVPKGDLAENPTDAGNTSEASVYGRVPYDFSIGKYEVSLAQYARFLNAVAATDTYGLYNTSMGTNDNMKGIARSGSDGSYTYSVIGSGNRPVTYVSWFDAARFCNWLHNECPSGVQGETTTECGAYTLDGATSGGLDITRNPGAKYWIPSEDEWYKAAYHRSNSQGGPADHYYQYPTMSDTAPGNTIGPLPLTNHANFYTTVFSVTQSAYSGTQNYLTDGGAYGGSASFYGTFDQGGNVWEWNDAVISGSSRGLRGGSWGTDESYLRSSLRNLDFPDDELDFIGFRVASP
jgi:formylglycine-generating enzyme required for sulfatase activity